MPVIMVKSAALVITGAFSADLRDMLSEAPQKTQFQVAHELFEEFCSSSTIHGVRYFVDKSRHWLERFWWVLMFVVSAVLCVYSILVIRLEDKLNPVSLYLENEPWQVDFIPFPAVTICPTKKIQKEYFDNPAFARAAFERDEETLKNLSAEDLNRLDALWQICRIQKPNLKNVTAIPKTKSIYQAIVDMNPDVFSVVQMSFFRGSIDFHAFKPIFKTTGICFTFNSLDSQDLFTNEVDPELIIVENDKRHATSWDMENGYRPGVEDVYPRRVFGPGLENALNVILTTTVDDSDQQCYPLSPGFHMALHTPDAIPHYPDDFVFIPIDHHVYVQVDVNMLTPSEHLRDYSPEKRGCVFESDRKLRFFKTYNENNCHLEQLTNFTKAKCGCVKFSMPRDNITKVCTLADWECFGRANQDFFRQTKRREECPPSCTSIKYDSSIIQFPWMDDDDEDMGIETNGSSIEASSFLSISFRKHSFIAFKRIALRTMTDFIADCGGLLNLFMGVSMLSVIELIYYYTIRLLFVLHELRLLQLRAFNWIKRKCLALQKNIIRRRQN